MSGAKCERPINRYQPPDWHARLDTKKSLKRFISSNHIFYRNSKLATNARNLRDDSLSVRKESQLLKVETETKTKWQNYENNVRLSERYPAYRTIITNP